MVIAGRRLEPRSVLGSLALLAVAVPFALECALIAVTPGHLPLYLGGDWALIDLATKAAAGWHQLLGPYDRFGWQHRARVRPRLRFHA